MSMMCEYPYLRDNNANRMEVRLDKEKALAATPFRCGRCLPCRINQRKIWTHRILLESYDHPYNCFLTLTYDDENLPIDMNVSVDEVQKFLKRLRNNLMEKIRYLAVGEYGDQTWRPHYHLAIFNMSPLAKKAVEKAWTKGFFKLEELNPTTARYICGYTMKKLTKLTDKRLEGRKPEFMTCSKKEGGLGLNTVELIATQMKEKKYYRKEDIINSIKHGKKDLPLGRYLTKKMAEFLGFDEEELFTNFEKYREELFDKHLDGKKDYYSSIVNEKAQARLNQKTKFEIRKGQRKL